ncbi:adenylosuccinate lyase family protein [Streptomyces sp. NBC_00986]|uniref:class-II fumarase/aspartase family protein n=1 Tax=Streptomyces sp. NBC_00986 TaxID=2903702 RepID=UPI00386A20AE|nr:adenylosuccinate lyase family protein [Streptomyces sp. NBC_00986]
MTSWIDSGLLSPVRAGTAVEAEVNDQAWLQAMLDAEAALARAQARLGTVPPSAAETIGRAARAERFDLRALALAARQTANPVVGLVQALTREVARTDAAAAEFVHRGSTSQDILDTAAMLVAVRTIGIIRKDLDRTVASLAVLAADHRDSVMAGRTLALQAVPTTFGLKAASWRQLVLDADHRLGRLAAEGLPVSLGGAAGTLAGYLEYARLDGADPLPPEEYVSQLEAAFAAETGLARQTLPWHALRTPMADLAAALAFTTGALGKIAMDVQNLTRTEVGEVSEPTVSGRGSSSAMPHKQNPVLSTLIRSAAIQVPVLAAGLTQCLISEDERSGGAWHAEWLLLRECLQLAGGAAETAVELVEGLVVRPTRMLENLSLIGSQLVSERITAWIAPELGKTAAKQLLGEVSEESRRTGRPFHQLLGERAELDGVLSATRLAVLSDPTDYVGAAPALVDRALRPSGTAGAAQGPPSDSGGHPLPKSEPEEAPMTPA